MEGLLGILLNSFSQCLFQSVFGEGFYRLIGHLLGTNSPYFMGYYGLHELTEPFLHCSIKHNDLIALLDYFLNQVGLFQFYHPIIHVDHVLSNGSWHLNLVSVPLKLFCSCFFDLGVNEGASNVFCNFSQSLFLMEGLLGILLNSFSQCLFQSVFGEGFYRLIGHLLGTNSPYFMGYYGLHELTEPFLHCSIKHNDLIALLDYFLNQVGLFQFYHPIIHVDHVLSNGSWHLNLVSVPLKLFCSCFFDLGVNEGASNVFCNFSQSLFLMEGLLGILLNSFSQCLFQSVFGEGFYRLIGHLLGTNSPYFMGYYGLHELTEPFLHCSIKHNDLIALLDYFLNQVGLFQFYHPIIHVDHVLSNGSWHLNLVSVPLKLFCSCFFDLGVNEGASNVFCNFSQSLFLMEGLLGILLNSFSQCLFQSVFGEGFYRLIGHLLGTNSPYFMGYYGLHELTEPFLHCSIKHNDLIALLDYFLNQVGLFQFYHPIIHVDHVLSNGSWHLNLVSVPLKLFCSCFFDLGVNEGASNVFCNFSQSLFLMEGLLGILLNSFSQCLFQSVFGEGFYRLIGHLLGTNSPYFMGYYGLHELTEPFLHCSIKPQRSHSTPWLLP